jgi:hypothetical protein
MNAKNHYVYAHSYRDEIIYIGMGHEGRAFAATGRKPLHKIFMSARLRKGDVSFVSFLETGLTEADAKALEAKLIRKFQPPLNRYFTDKWRDILKNKGLKGAEKSRRPVITPKGRFESLTKAALAHEVTISAIYLRIKNHKEGYCYA